jgi:hypothetical protein
MEFQTRPRYLHGTQSAERYRKGSSGRLKKSKKMKITSLEVIM